MRKRPRKQHRKMAASLAFRDDSRPVRIVRKERLNKGKRSQRSAAEFWGIGGDCKIATLIIIMILITIISFPPPCRSFLEKRTRLSSSKTRRKIHLLIDLAGNGPVKPSLMRFFEERSGFYTNGHWVKRYGRYHRAAFLQNSTLWIAPP